MKTKWIISALAGVVVMAQAHASYQQKTAATWQDMLRASPENAGSMYYRLSQPTDTPDTESFSDVTSPKKRASQETDILCVVARSQLVGHYLDGKATPGKSASAVSSLSGVENMAELVGKPLAKRKIFRQDAMAACHPNRSMVNKKP